MFRVKAQSSVSLGDELTVNLCAIVEDRVVRGSILCDPTQPNPAAD